MKRSEGVPRGLLRFIFLKFLVEMPLLGSEIVGKIERETGGKWKPVSGSIYPPLTGLQEKGFTQELSTIESGNVEEIARILDNSNVQLRKIIEKINGEK